MIWLKNLIRRATAKGNAPQMSMEAANEIALDHTLRFITSYRCDEKFIMDILREIDREAEYAGKITCPNLRQAYTRRLKFCKERALDDLAAVQKSLKVQAELRSLGYTRSDWQ